MIRPLTLITALMFLLSGAAMFAVKHRAEVMGQQIIATNQAIKLDQQRIIVLNSQWAQYTNFDRLQQLASKYTNLAPAQPNQTVTLAQLVAALPAAGSQPPVANPAAVAPDALPQTGQVPVTDPAVLLADAAPPVDSVTAPAPAVAAAPLPLPARAAPRLPVTLRLASFSPAPVLHHHHVHLLHHEAPSELAMATVHDHPYVPPAGTQIVAARVVEPAPVATAAPAMDDGGSLLGMAQTMGAGGVN